MNNKIVRRLNDRKSIWLYVVTWDGGIGRQVQIIIIIFYSLNRHVSVTFKILREIKLAEMKTRVD